MPTLCFYTFDSKLRISVSVGWFWARGIGHGGRLKCGRKPPTPPTLGIGIGNIQLVLLRYLVDYFIDRVCCRGDRCHIGCLDRVCCIGGFRYHIDCQLRIRHGNHF